MIVVVSYVTVEKRKEGRVRIARDCILIPKWAGKKGQENTRTGTPKDQCYRQHQLALIQGVPHPAAVCVSQV